MDYARELGEAHANIEQLRTNLTQHEALRDEIIREAYAKTDMTIREIAKHAGISYGRVAQILRD